MAARERLRYSHFHHTAIVLPLFQLIRQSRSGKLKLGKKSRNFLSDIILMPYYSMRRGRVSRRVENNFSSLYSMIENKLNPLHITVECNLVRHIHWMKNSIG